MPEEKPTVDFASLREGAPGQQGAAVDDLLWAFLTEQGVFALYQGLAETAERLWRLGQGQTREMAERDPRRATALNNLGLAHRLDGRLEMAEASFREALTAWEAAADWVETMAIAPRAASSAFHIQLEAKHGRDQFEPAAREEARRDLAAAWAFALGNLGETVFRQGNVEEAEQLLARAVALRERGTGPRDRGLEVLRANEGVIQGDESGSSVGHHTGRSNEAVPDQWYPWKVVGLTPFNDEEVLRAALRLAVLGDARDLAEFPRQAP